MGIGFPGLPTLREAGGVRPTAIQPRKAPLQNLGPLRDPDPYFLSALSFSNSPLAAKVSEITAMGVSTVFACVNYIASVLSTLPIDLYRKTKNGREEITDHPALRLLTIRPNPVMTPSDVRYSWAFNQALHGNGFGQLVFDRMGRPSEVYPLRARNVTVRPRPDTIFPEYYVTGSRRSETVDFEHMMHLKGVTPDGLCAYSTMGLVAGLIGYAQALDNCGEAFFANGAKPGLTYVLPPGSADTEPQRKILKEQLDSAFKGVANFHKTMVLPGGGKLEFTQMPNDVSQFDETTRRVHGAVCQVFGVPPHKVGILDHATFSNIEHQQIQAVQDLFRPWCVRWNEVFRGALLTPEEQRTHFFTHNLDAVLQADIKTRFDAYGSGLQNGHLCPNEVRALENRNPIPGGDTYVRQTNLTDINAPPPVAKPATPSAEQIRATIQQLQNLLPEAA